MTQAYNLAILANAVDSSGKLNVATNSTGVLPVANGGTGTATPSLVAGTNISITGTFPNQTINNTSSASGTVTSVATGNGLSGGTITTTGTLTLACPSFNSVGSYVQAGYYTGCGSAQCSAGSNYSAGSAQQQIRSCVYGNNTQMIWNSSTNLSGTWKWMSATGSDAGGSPSNVGLACRVS